MNDLMVSAMPVNVSRKGAKMKFPPPLIGALGLPSAPARFAATEIPDARERQLRQSQDDWRMLAREWQALGNAIRRFEQEFQQLEASFDRRWKR